MKQHNIPTYKFLLLTFIASYSSGCTNQYVNIDPTTGIPAYNMAEQIGAGNEAEHIDLLIKLYSLLENWHQEGNLEKFRNILNSNARIAINHLIGNKPLLNLAIDCNAIEYVNELLKYPGIDVNIKNKLTSQYSTYKTDSPIILAIRKNNLDMVDRLLQQQASLDLDADGDFTPLFLALLHPEFKSIAERLFAEKDNMTEDTYVQTITLLLKYRNVEQALYLLQRIPQIAIMHDIYDDTPLYVICKQFSNSS